MYRLLIVDNNAARCQETAALLDWSEFGFSSVLTAGSYMEAVDKAMDFRPHAALVNLRLDSHMGYELAAHLHSAGIDTVFCILADENSPKLIRESMRFGARDYLLRPLNPVELRTFLERVVGAHAEGQSVSVQATQEVDPVLGVECAGLSRITNKIIRIVRSDYRSALTLTVIAEELDMSAKYIGRVFLRDSGIKFSEYLMSYRMLEARKLIVNTQEKVSVIANMVGYVQMNNFYIHFKNYFGVSPRALRNYEVGREPEAPQGEKHEESI